MTDQLSNAVRALRLASDAPPDDAASTRARIMMSLHQRRLRRSQRTAWLIPFGIVVAASSAWAGSNGKVTTLLHAIGESVAAHTPAAELDVGATEVERRGIERRLDIRAFVGPQVAKSSPPAETSVTAGSTAALRSSPKPAHRETVANPKRVAMPSPDEPGFEAYLAAHHAHFRDRNPSAALPAWDEYLREAPSGRFTSEARYNRALCLVRVGRYTEAKAALVPFARGDFGKYRQREANELLGAIGAVAR